MLKTTKINSEFSGIRFRTIRDIEYISPKYPEFPGLNEANADSADFDLPKILRITFLDEGDSEFIEEFDYSELITIGSFDEKIPREFNKLASMQHSLSDEMKAIFVSELGLVITRFLLTYSPVGVEIYQTLKNVDLSVSILWQLFGLRWVTMVKIFNDGTSAPVYVNCLLLMLFRIRDISVCDPAFAQEVNKYPFMNKKGSATRNSSFFSSDKIETSEKVINSLFKSVQYLDEQVTTCQFPLKKEAFDSLTTGIKIELLSKDVPIEVTVFEALQFSLLIELPQKLALPEFNTPLMMDALKAIILPYFLSQKVSKIDAIFLLDSFKVGKNWIANLGIPKSTEYYRSTVDNKDRAHPGLLGAIHMVIWDGKANYEPTH